MANRLSFEIALGANLYDVEDTLSYKRVLSVKKISVMRWTLGLNRLLHHSRIQDLIDRGPSVTTYQKSNEIQDKGEQAWTNKGRKEPNPNLVYSEERPIEFSIQKKKENTQK